MEGTVFIRRVGMLREERGTTVVVVAVVIVKAKEHKNGNDSNKNNNSDDYDFRKRRNRNATTKMSILYSNISRNKETDLYHA